MENYSLIIPYFNEGITITATLNEYGNAFSRIGVNFEIVIVDDGSSKTAATFLKEAPPKYEYTLIEHRYNKGYGSAIRTGINNANYENIIITDSDNTYPTESLKKMIFEYEKLETGMVIGSREGKRANIPIIRKPAKYFLRKLASYLCEDDIRDLNSGLRIFNKELYLKFEHLMPTRFSMTSTITILSSMDRSPIVYVPTSYRKRIGKSSISPLKDTLRFFNLIIKLVILTDGMRIFLPISFLMLFTSFLFLILRIVGVGITSSSIVTLFCSSLNILCIGAICKLINYTNGRNYN